MKKKSKTKKETKLKCEKCKGDIDFYFHECSRAIQEYLGCKTCDDWCTSCNPDWAVKE